MRGKNTLTPINFTQDDLQHSIGTRFLKVITGLPPDHLAYVDGEKKLTYQELSDASHALAAALLGILPPDAPQEQRLVGLLLDPDWHELQALIGVALAGAYYLVLDQEAAAQQLLQSLEQFPIKALITTSDYRTVAARLTAVQTDCQIIFLDELTAAQDPLDLPLIDSRAYQAVYFTSGSTGRPRGVIRTHGTGLLSSYLAANDLQLGPADRITLTSSIAMAMSITPSLGALLNGATIYRQMDALISPAAFYEWLRRDRISVARSSAGLLRSLLQLPDSLPVLPDLRLVDTGGEAFAREEVEGLLALMPADGLLNVRLASSEAGNYALFRVRAGDFWLGEKNPAGYPPEHVQVSIVDQDRKPLPPGEEGEIAVTGRFLAAGYFRDPKQTQARFLPNPKDPSEITYFTGDIGRMDPDGLVHFIGRKDFRVKVRGYTIELEAVDLALRGLEGVADAASAVQVLPSGNKRLVGYVVPLDGGELPLEGMRRGLRQVLPQHMVPSVLVATDSLPRTHTGKIDRNALPLPPISRPELEVPYRPPTSPQEIRLAQIWERTLDVSPVGVDDSFFVLGGDSLMSMEMILEVEMAYGCKISQEFFNQPTITNLSRLILADRQYTHSQEVTFQEEALEGVERSRLRRLLKLFLRPGDLWFSLILRVRKPFSQKFLRMGYLEGMARLSDYVRKPAIQQMFFYREKQIFELFASNLDLASDRTQENLVKALAAGTWADALMNERHQAVMTSGGSPRLFWQDLYQLLEESSPDSPGPLVRLSGFDHLRSAYQRGQGVILLSYHSNLVRLPAMLIQKWLEIDALPAITPQLRLRLDRDTNEKSLQGEDSLEAIAVEQARRGANALLQGFRLLGEGQIIRVYIDNGIASRGTWPAEVCGKQYMMRAGWADLAVQTNAAVIPIIAALNLDGSFELKFLPALKLSNQEHTREEKIGELIEQYAHFLSSAYQEYPWSFGWRVMENHYKMPDAAPE